MSERPDRQCEHGTPITSRCLDCIYPNPEPNAREMDLEAIKRYANSRGMHRGTRSNAHVSILIEAYQELERELSARNAELELFKRARDKRIKEDGEMAALVFEERAKVAGLCEALRDIEKMSNKMGPTIELAREALKRFGEGK